MKQKFTASIWQEDVKFAKTTGEGTLTATVPKHREVAAGTLRSILRQAHLRVEEFDRL